MDASSVKRAPEYWKYLPYFSKLRGLLFIKTIYLRSEVYDDVFLSDSPNAQNVGVLIHEKTHLERMNKIGMFRFGLKYVFSGKGRFEEELAAISEQMKYLKSKGAMYDIEKGAKALSSWLYLWCTTYEYAFNELAATWEKF